MRKQIGSVNSRIKEKEHVLYDRHMNPQGNVTSLTILIPSPYYLTPPPTRKLNISRSSEDTIMRTFHISCWYEANPTIGVIRLQRTLCSPSSSVGKQGANSITEIKRPHLPDPDFVYPHNILRYPLVGLFHVRR